MMLKHIWKRKPVLLILVITCSVFLVFTACPNGLPTDGGDGTETEGGTGGSEDGTDGTGGDDEDGTGGSGSSNDASLSGFSISSGTLSPAFSSTTYSYSANVENSVSSITITPTCNHGGALVTVDGTAVASGSASGAVALSVGDTAIDTVVTAEDGTTTKTYTVTVTRAAASPTRTLSVSVEYTGSEPVAAGTPMYAIFIADADSSFLYDILTSAGPETLSYTDADDGLQSGTYHYSCFVDADGSGDKSHGDPTADGSFSVVATGLTEETISFDDSSKVEGTFSFTISNHGASDGQIQMITARRDAVAISEWYGEIHSPAVSGGAAAITMYKSGDGSDPLDGVEYLFRLLWDKDDDLDASDGDEYVVLSSPILYEDASAPISTAVDWSGAEVYTVPADAVQETINITISGGPQGVSSGSFEMVAMHLDSFNKNEAVFSASTDGSGNGTENPLISLYEGDHRLVLYYDANGDGELDAGENYSVIESQSLTGAGPHGVTFDSWSVY